MRHGQLLVGLVSSGTTEYVHQPSSRVYEEDAQGEWIGFSIRFQKGLSTHRYGGLG